WQHSKVIFRPSFAVSEGSAFDFSPRGGQLALGQSDGTLTIHDLTTRKETIRISVRTDPVRLAFSPDGTRMAVSFASERQVREAATGNLLCTLSHPAHVVPVAWHPDGVLLGTGGDDGKIYLWDAV